MGPIETSMIRIHVRPTQSVQAVNPVSRIVATEGVKRDENWHDNQGKMEKDFEKGINISEKKEGVKTGLL